MPLSINLTLVTTHQDILQFFLTQTFFLSNHQPDLLGHFYFSCSFPSVSSCWCFPLRQLQPSQCFFHSASFNSASCTRTFPHISSRTGLVSLAHLNIEAMSLTNPVSLGFSRPLCKRFFMTATNSLLLSWPSSVR